MRTTLDIPSSLMEEAKRVLGFKSKTDIIIFSIRELLKRKRLEELKGLAGKIKLDIDIDNSRRRKFSEK